MSAAPQQTQDSGFEIAFSEIAHAQLATKAPGLSSYLVGFQILDQDDDETRAAGVFGCKYEDSWLYCPAFFINGRVRGLEMIYVAKPDLFVPLTDAWVNFMLSHRGRTLGTYDTRTMGELGALGPDISPIADYPGRRRGFGWNKFASDETVIDPEWRMDPGHPVRRMFEKMNKLAGFDFDYAKAALSTVDLARAFGKAPSLALPLAAEMKANEKFAEAVFSFYSAADLFRPLVTEMRKSAAVALDKDGRPDGGGRKVPWIGWRSDDAADIWAGIKTGKTSLKPSLVTEHQAKQASTPPVEVITRKNAEQFAAGLTEKEREAMMAGKVVVRDSRADSEVSKVVGSDVSGSLFNPGSMSGRYEMLVRPAGLMKVRYWSDPMTIGEGDTRYVGLILSEDNAKGGLVDRRALSTTRELPRDFDKLFSRAEAIPAMRTGRMYVLIDDHGHASVPFKFLSRVEKGDETSSYYAVVPDESMLKADFSLSRLGDRGPSLGRARDYDSDRPKVEHLDNGREKCYFGSPGAIYKTPSSTGGMDSGPGWRGNLRYYSDWELERARRIIVLDDQHLGRPVPSGDTLCLPKGKWKVLDLGWPRGSSGVDGPDFEPIEPGNAASLDQWLLQVTTPLKVVKSGGDYWFGSINERRRLNPDEALEHLIVGWGLRKEAAEHILANAGGLNSKWYVKKAEATATVSAPGFPPYTAEYDSLIGSPAQRPQYNEVPVLGMRSQPRKRNDYRLSDDNEVKTLLQAAKDGRKDVFDVGNLTQLVKATDISELIDDFQPDMIRGLDRVGRVYYLFFWHYDAFNERYGKQDVLDLEESLRNVFKSLGDLVLFLKQKTIENNPVLRSMDIDLGGIVG